MTAPNQHPPVTEEDKARWGKLLDEGWSYKEIARTEGRHRRTIARWVPGRGWTRDQISGLGTFMKHHNEKMRLVS